MARHVEGNGAGSNCAPVTRPSPLPCALCPLRLCTALALICPDEVGTRSPCPVSRSSPAALAASAWASPRRSLRDGMGLALCGMRPPDAVADVAERASRARDAGSSTGGRTSASARIVTRSSAGTLARFGAVSALVNNAGRRRACAPTCSTPARTASKNCSARTSRARIFLTQAIARLHDRRRGWATAPRAAAIVFITSVSAELASPNRGEYCVSKAGLAMAVKLFAARLAPARHSGLRSAARHHRHGHDGGRQGRLRPAHRRRARTRRPLGYAGRRRPRRRGAGGRRPALRDRHGHPRRRGTYGSANSEPTTQT